MVNQPLTLQPQRSQRHPFTLPRSLSHDPEQGSSSPHDKSCARALALPRLGRIITIRRQPGALALARSSGIATAEVSCPMRDGLRRCHPRSDGEIPFILFSDFPFCLLSSTIATQAIALVCIVLSSIFPLTPLIALTCHITLLHLVQNIFICFCMIHLVQHVFKIASRVTCAPGSDTPPEQSLFCAHCQTC